MIAGSDQARFRIVARAGRGLFTCSLFLCAFYPEPAVAAGKSVEACFDAYEQTQVARKGNDPIVALEKAEQCASGCPEEIMSECRVFLRQAEADIPTALLFARTEAGEDATNVNVEIDGKSVRGALGAEISLTVGPHTFRFSRGPWEETIKVNVLLGEKRRQIRVTVPEEKRDDPKVLADSVRDPLRPLTIGAFSLGGAGFVASLVGLIGGLSMKATLENCAPECDLSQTARAHRYLTVADVGLIVGGVGTVAGITLFATSGARKERRLAKLTLLPAGFGFKAGVQADF